MSVHVHHAHNDGKGGADPQQQNLRDLNGRLSRMEDSAPESLSTFFEPALLSFSIKPGTTDGRISITSTCFALQAILSASQDPNTLYRSMISMDTQIKQLDDDSRIPVRDIVQALILASDWRPDDLFQVPVLLYTLLVVDQGRHVLGKTIDEATAARIRQLISAVLAARPRRRDGLESQYSDYITFQCARVYAELYSSEEQISSGPINELDEGGPDSFEDLASDDLEDNDSISMAGLSSNALPNGSWAEVSLALQRTAESSYNQLCRQLALRAARDDSAFDIMRLAYSLLSYLVSTNSLAGRTAGRELVRGQGPTKGSKVRPVNPRLVTAALAAFFAEQQPNGLWEKGQPIYRSFRRTGRNVGNAFVFAVDTVSTLLQELPPESFRPFLFQLERTTDWLERNYIVEILPDYCDPETGICYGRALRGWPSPHLSPEEGPQAWSTAQAIACLSRIKTVVETLRHNTVLREFSGVACSVDGAAPQAWDRLLDSDLGPAADHRTLKQVLDERMISPRIASSQSSIVSASFSAVLFGPPGTAKTTICEALAKRLGWDFVVIDTSVFLADGLTNVASRIRYVFGQLLALRRCVVLFDEIEEFCLDRQATGIGMESRMLTTAMLTAINDLRRAKRCIFFMATNRLRALDAAITRPGRFDLQLFVGTPNLSARTIQFQQKLADIPAGSTSKHEALVAYEEFLATVWEKDARYMNYLEGVQFAGACAALVAKGVTLDQENMERILQSQVAVMTVRGTVRDEFDASMGLSRL